MAKSKIDETLKNLAGATSRAKSKTSSSASAAPSLGDPNCPHCHGLGYLRREAEPGSPDFGKLDICTCRQEQVSQTVRQRLFSLSHLDELKNLTFESFKVTGRGKLGKLHLDSLEWAFKRTMQFASSLQGWLIIMGGYGCGKTHLAAAIANFAVGMGVPTLFLTVPDLLDSLRFSYDSDDTTFEQRFDEIRNAPLLILDDFGTQNATPWAQEKLFQVVNYRYINKLPLVVTTNLDLDEIEARIRSRFQDPLVEQIHIQAPDFRQSTPYNGNSELSSLGLHTNRTFETFNDRLDEGLSHDEIKSLDKAIKNAKAFASKPHGWLVLTGTYGCGKTHLAAAAANMLADKGISPLFIMVPDLLDHLRATFSPSSPVSYDRRFDEIRTAPLLILDDLGAQSMSPWAREKLHQLLDYRYNAELPTIITIAVDMLEGIDQRLRVRLLDERLVNFVTITAPAFHGSKKKTKK